MSDQTQPDTTTDQSTATTDTTPNSGAKGDSSEIVFTPEQQELINKRIASARREGRTAAESEAAEAKRKADEATANQKLIEAGEFDKVRQSLESERDAATTERDSLKSRLETALTLIGATVDQEWKAAPEAVTKLYKGEDTDVLAKRQHLADHVDIIAALIGKQDERKQAAGFGRTPKPNGSLTNLEKGIEAGKRSGKYSA